MEEVGNVRFLKGDVLKERRSTGRPKKHCSDSFSSRNRLSAQQKERKKETNKQNKERKRGGGGGRGGRSSALMLLTTITLLT
jgi:hypothetical protein